MNVKSTVIDYFKKHKNRLFIIITIIIFVTILSLIPAQILRIVTDEGINEKKLQILLIYSIFYSIIYLVIGITTFIKDIIMLSASQDITYDLRCNMMKHIHHMNYNSLINTDSGTLEAYFNNDVNSINELFTKGIVNIFTD